MGKKNGLVNDTSIPDAGVVSKPESRRIRQKVHMGQVEVPTVGLFAEIKVLYALHGAAVIVLGGYVCDASSSVCSTNLKTGKLVGA